MKPRVPRRPKTQRVEPPDDAGLDERLKRVVERPDGFHWIDVQGRQEFGPYETVEAALGSMDPPSNDGMDPTERVEEDQQTLGIEAIDEHAHMDEPDAR